MLEETYRAWRIAPMHLSDISKFLAHEMITAPFLLFRDIHVYMCNLNVASIFRATISSSHWGERLGNIVAVTGRAHARFFSESNRRENGSAEARDSESISHNYTPSVGGKKRGRDEETGASNRSGIGIHAETIGVGSRGRRVANFAGNFDRRSSLRVIHPRQTNTGGRREGRRERKRESFTARFRAGYILDSHTYTYTGAGATES